MGLIQIGKFFQGQPLWLPLFEAFPFNDPSARGFEQDLTDGPDDQDYFYI